jgi:hypothetical protein
MSAVPRRRGHSPAFFILTDGGGTTPLSVVVCLWEWGAPVLFGAPFF